jgi:hypothetical protein
MRGRPTPNAAASPKGLRSMSKKSSLKRLIGLGTWLTLVAVALAFVLRWRGAQSRKSNS